MIEEARTDSWELTEMRITGGVALIAEEKYAPAMPLLEEVANRHRSLAAAWYPLGAPRRKLTKFNDAVRACGLAIAILEETSRTNSVAYGNALNTFNLVLHDQAQYKKAEPLFPRAMTTIFETRRAANHPSTATLLNNFAGALESQVGYLGSRGY